MPMLAGEGEEVMTRAERSKQITEEMNYEKHEINVTANLAENQRMPWLILNTLNAIYKQLALMNETEGDKQ